MVKGQEEGLTYEIRVVKKWNQKKPFEQRELIYSLSEIGRTTSWGSGADLLLGLSNGMSH